MCLIVFALDTRDDFRLVLAGNRDEFYQRPTAPLSWRTVNGTRLLAGQDLQAGGTWLGISAAGRFGAVTNFRESRPAPSGVPSRGELITAFVCGNQPAAEYMQLLQDTGSAFAPFSLLFGNASEGELHYFSNRAPAPLAVTSGLHGLSNHLLNTPWPKTRRSTARLGNVMSDVEGPDDEALFAMLADREGASDGDLPDTGIGMMRERILASPFIITETYGTRCSSILTVTSKGVCRFVERSFDSRGNVTGQRHEQFDIESDQVALV